MGRIIYFSAKRKRFHTHTSSVECVVCIALHCRREFSCRNSNWTELRRWKSWSRQWHACAGMSTERRCKRKHSERRQRWRRRRQAPQYACEAHTKKMLDRKQKSRDETQPRARSARKLQKWLNPIFMSTLNTIYENCFLQFLSFRFAFLFKRFKREYLNFLLVSQSSTSSTSCSYRGLVARAPAQHFCVNAEKCIRESRVWSRQGTCECVLQTSSTRIFRSVIFWWNEIKRMAECKIRSEKKGEKWTNWMKNENVINSEQRVWWNLGEWRALYMHWKWVSEGCGCHCTIEIKSLFSPFLSLFSSYSLCMWWYRILQVDGICVVNIFVHRTEKKSDSVIFPFFAVTGM